MGVFDFFGKEPKTRSQRPLGQNKEAMETLNNSDDSNRPVSVFSPDSFNDVETIIDVLKTGKNAVVHLEELKTETAIRILDLLSGAIYALGGGVYEMGKNVFMFSPSGVEVY